jgi:hypothetical protein
MRTYRYLILFLALIALVALVILFYSATSAPSVNLAVSFVGVTNDTDGAPMSVFSITNRGKATAVIWGYYTIDAKQQCAVRYRTIFSDHYAFLVPGKSQKVEIHPPETKGLWKVSIGYENYDSRCRWVLFAASLPPRIRDAIPQQFRDISKDLIVSDWVER